MRSRLRVLFITSEVYPLCKTGGLGDVSAALPVALRALRTDARLLLPGYPQVLAGVKYQSKVADFSHLTQFPPSTLLSARLSLGGSAAVPVFVIDCPGLFQRTGGPYMDEFGRDWPDNVLRFGLLSKIGAILSSDDSPLAWRPHVAHCNDWQSGLVPAYLHDYPGWKAAVLMTVHNLAYQGIFPPGSVAQLGLPQRSFNIDGVEYYGNLSFLKAGLYYADHITTVSPNYAQEIQTEPLGFGLQGLLAARCDRLTGIVNGIDTCEWDAVTDIHLVKNYSSRSLADKAINKAALQRQMGLAVDAELPLFGAVSRLNYQKGTDLLIQLAPQLLGIPAQLVVLGSGDAALEHQLSVLASNYPDAMAVRIGFDEALSHRVEAGVDCFLMPSRFEPCGLNQMYSQRYGTPPVVHATGGLKDTVIDCVPATLADGSASGFVCASLSSGGLMHTISRAVLAYRNKRTWLRIQQNGMMKDFSWRASAQAYREIYLELSENTVN
ncbi:MAG: glycogen synthase GlgA [Nitrosomonas sp.]|nr:MAG: glycogen synthase GlgA [Nitrosomonas sp.]